MRFQLRILASLALLAFLGRCADPVKDECKKPKDPSSKLPSDGQLMKAGADIDACAASCKDDKPPKVKTTAADEDFKGTCAAILFAGANFCYGFASDKLTEVKGLPDSPDKAKFVELSCIDPTSSTTSTTTSSSPTSPTPSPEEDKFNKLSDEDKKKVCCLWAADGQCDKNIFWMRPKCQEACGTAGCTVTTATSCKVTVSASCGASSTTSTKAGDASSTTPSSASDDCKDIGGGQCPQWSQGGECDKNPYWMKVYCAKSCKSCGTTAADLDKKMKDPKCPAADKNPSCGYWASTQECTKNAGWMNANCASSCKKCPA